MQITDLKDFRKRPTEILTPESPRWQTFIDRLAAALDKDGCDARTQRHAEAVMRDMGGVNVDATREYLEEHGGYCDCEILMNVDPGFWS